MFICLLAYDIIDIFQSSILWAKGGKPSNKTKTQHLFQLTLIHSDCKSEHLGLAVTMQCLSSPLYALVITEFFKNTDFFPCGKRRGTGTVPFNQVLLILLTLDTDLRQEEHTYSLTEVSGLCWVENMSR